ncbi:MAG: pitrilysin family protein [Chloroflexota bacterium]
MYQKTTLENGLRLVTSAMPHTQSVCISIFVGVGSRYETAAKAGISHFIEHLCFKGTPRRPTARDISLAIEGVGGILNGGTDKELTVYWCKVACTHFQRALDVMVDMVRYPRLDPKDIQSERQVIIEEINMTKDVPAQEVNLLIDEVLWAKHPLGRDIAGSKASVTAMSREMMLDHLHRYYSPGNIVIAIAGNISHQDIAAAVRQVTADWASHPPPGYTAYTERPAPRVRLETRDSEQAHLCLALPGLPLLHPDRFTLDLINVILGEGMSSRLFTEIRDKLGLAYSIHSDTEHFHDTGSLTIYAGMEPGNLTLAIRAILKQLARLKEPVPEDEMASARELTKGRLLLRLEDSRSMAGWVGGQEVLTGQILTPDEVIATVDTITTADAERVANELLVADRLRLAVVGPITHPESLAGLLVL